MNSSILRSVKKFFHIGQILQNKSLEDERIKAGKSGYVSEDKLEEFTRACKKLDDIKVAQRTTAKELKQLNEQLVDLSQKIIRQADKDGMSTPKNFSFATGLSELAIKTAAIVSAVAAGLVLVSEAVRVLIKTYEDTKESKTFNEKLYEKLLNEEYEERKYIIGLLEDLDKEKEIEQTQSVISLPSVEAVRTYQPVPQPAPPPPPKPIYNPPPAIPDRPVVEPPKQESPVYEQAPVSQETVSVPEPVTEPVVEPAPVENIPVEAEIPQETVTQESIEPPPAPSVYGAPKMSFSNRKSFALFESTMTRQALKALGLEKPAEILGTTVVTTIIIHYVEQALGEIHDLVSARLRSIGDQQHE